MSDSNDQCSDASSDLNWPLDHSTERQVDDQVVFENVADQYVKGEDVTVFFTILQDIKVNSEEDQVGLLRVGCTNITECLAYVSVQFNPSTTSGSTRHGTATFPAASLPVTDDEFYQFCYIINKTKNIGCSVPFQLNCSLDDIDLLSNTPVRKIRADGLIALADNDNDDVVVVHTKRMLTEEKLRQENRHLLEINRRLELEKKENQEKSDLLELKHKEQINAVSNEIQTLKASYRTIRDELASRQQSESKLRTEHDTCRALCNQYEAELLARTKRCDTLEDAFERMRNESNQIQLQLSMTSQLTKEQASKIVDLERRLMQASDSSEKSNQRQAQLEQQIRDLQLESEKYRGELQTELATSSKQVAEKDNHINELETVNILLKEEINSLKNDNESLSAVSQQEKELSQKLEKRLEQLYEQCSIESERAQKDIKSLESQLNEMNLNQNAYASLKASIIEIEKRCCKHQKGELDAKRKLKDCKGVINDLQRENQELTERLADGSEEYKALYRKCAALERKTQTFGQNDKINSTALAKEPLFSDEQLESVLRNAGKPLQKDVEEQKDQTRQSTSLQSLANDIETEISECPMCYEEFPEYMTLEQKQEHIENHLT